jgi:hypothetical protein
MDFAGEITQLLVIIIILVAAYCGLNFWMKRGGSFSIPSFGDKSSKHPDGDPSLTHHANAHLNENPSVKKGSQSSAVERHGNKFNLTGKNAETAARVLKGMLKQGKESKGK